MKTPINKSKIIVLFLLVALISFSCKEKATEKAPEAKQKNTAQASEEKSIQDYYDELDYQRAVQSYLWSVPAMYTYSLRESLKQTFGASPNDVPVWKDLMDAKTVMLTPNSQVVYAFNFLDLKKDGPTVLEAAPKMAAMLDDMWDQPLTDIGATGPDKGKGGKYLILPPGYEGEVPEGYYSAQSATYGNWLLIRGFLDNGDPTPGVKNIKDNFKLYPYGKTAADSKVSYHDISMKYLNTIHANDYTYFEEINNLVQEEPNEATSPEILGLLASIGVEKGKLFNPDARMKKILNEAAEVGSAASRVLLYRNRDPEALVYPNSGWEHPWVGGSSTFERNGVRLIDARCRFHMYATGITPAMVNPTVGSGTQYIAGLRDSDGNPFDGAKTYKVHLPPNVPARQFWAFTLYNVQTRSMLQTDQRFPEITSADASIEQNADRSYDVYFGPEAPAGKEKNWVQTIPGKGWHMLFRLYGPEQAWFDKTWRPSEVELVK